MKYNKLVRDKIVQIIKNRGEEPVFHIADNKEYWQKLREKLQEEVKEFLADENIEEMADILEVLEAVRLYKKFSKQKLAVVQQKKAKEKGAFKKKIILEKS